MAFHFSLETVLRFRQSLERQQELRFEQAHHRVVLVQQAIEDVDYRLIRLVTQENDELQSGIAAAEVQFNRLCWSVLTERRQQLEKELAQRNEERRRCLEALQLKRREREAVETLRRQQLQLYRLEETRQQQRRLDDMFLLRREFLRRG